MINLFKTIYLQSDNLITCSSDQSRIIFTDRQYKHPFVPTEVMAVPGIKDTIFSMEELETKYGDIEGFLNMLWLSGEKLVVIASPQFLATLLIYYWKGLFADSTADSLYKLYRYFIYNENLFTATLNRYESDDGLQEDRELVPLDLDTFAAIYKSTGSCELSRNMDIENVPIEYLLAGYFAKTNSDKHNRVMRDKVKHLVLCNLIDILENDRPHFFRSTHNQYLLDGGPDSKEIINPLDVIRKNPKYVWLFDEKFSQKNLSWVMSRYHYAGIKQIFEMYNTVFSKNTPFYAAQSALPFLEQDDIDGLLDYDIQDENATFFTERLYLRKINTLLISHFYQLVRFGRSDELAVYKLAS